jgi:hypothetical protein
MDVPLFVMRRFGGVASIAAAWVAGDVATKLQDLAQRESSRGPPDAAALERRNSAVGKKLTPPFPPNAA